MPNEIDRWLDRSKRNRPSLKFINHDPDGYINPSEVRFVVEENPYAEDPEVLTVNQTSWRLTIDEDCWDAALHLYPEGVRRLRDWLNRILDEKGGQDAKNPC